MCGAITKYVLFFKKQTTLIQRDRIGKATPKKLNAVQAMKEL